MDNLKVIDQMNTVYRTHSNVRFMRFHRSKKGVIFGVAFLVAIIFLLGYAFFRVYVQDDQFVDQRLGVYQLAVFNTINEAEKVLLYLDQSTQYAYEQALVTLARKGGIVSACGMYRGVNLWINHGTVCPLVSEQALGTEMNFALDGYAKTYPEYTLPLQNYDLFMKGSTVVGMAKQPLEFDIVTFESLEYEPLYYPLDRYSIPKGAKNKVKKIYTTYKSFIEQASLETGVEIPWIVAVIAQESAGKSTAKSEVGAKGLMQLMDATAQRMASHLHLPAGYAVFDPQTNIRMGAQYLKEIMSSHFVKEGDVVDERHISAAYNGGLCNQAKTRGALCPSKTCVGRRFWECELNPGYKETREYVPAVLGFKKIFEEWQQETAEALPPPVTGYVSYTSRDPRASTNLGIYRVNPSVSMTPTLNFDEFRVVNTYALEFYNTVMSCKKKAALDSCISSSLVIFNHRGIPLSDDCQSNKEKVFYDFTEALKGCAASSARAGLCSFTLHSRRPYSGTYAFTIVPETGVEEQGIDMLLSPNVEIAFDRTTLVDNFPLGSERLPTLAIGPTATDIDNRRSCGEIQVTLDYDKRTILLQAQSCGGERQAYTWRYDTTLPLYKSSQTVSFVHPQLEVSSLKILEPSPATASVFCIPTAQATKSVRAYDPVEDKILPQPLVYNFALNFDEV